MKKNLFVLSILSVLALASCDAKSTQEETSSKEEVKANDGLTLETAFSVDELLEFMKDFAENSISDKEYYVTGEIVSSSYNSTYKSYTCYFKDHGKSDATPVQIYSGVIDSSITDTYTNADALKGATVVVKGYLQFYSNTEKGEVCYELPYMSKTKSPTGNAYSPTILKITGGTKDTSGGQQQTEGNGTVFGNNTQETAWATEPSGLQSVVFDFTSEVVDSFSTIGDYNFASANLSGKEANTYFSTNYARWASKDSSAVAYLANTTAFNGNIYKVVVEMATATSGNESSVSALCPYVVDLGTSALSGSTANSGGKGSSGHIFTVYAKEGTNYSYFALSTVKGVSSSGKASWYNGCVAKITVYYVPSK